MVKFILIKNSWSRKPWNSKKRWTICRYIISLQKSTFYLFSSTDCAHDWISLPFNSPNVSNMATCWCGSSHAMINIGNLHMQAIKHGIKNKKLISYSDPPWQSYKTQVFCWPIMQTLPNTIPLISHICWFQCSLHCWFLSQKVQYRVP